MDLLTNYRQYNKEKECVVVLGKFDGVHKGHQKLFLEAKKYNMPVVAFTFSIGNNKYLTNSSDRAEMLASSGVAVVIEQEYSKAFFEMLPEEFIAKVLVDKLKAKVIVCGEDFGFGKNRTGNVQCLKEMAGEYGYEVCVVQKELFENVPISSTRIREAVCTGNVSLAEMMLGYRYFLDGEVVQGNQLGRKFNFPTVNIWADENKILPKNGVYATVITINDNRYCGITNVGVKPTVNKSNRPNVETYIFDFKQNVYGRQVKIEFCEYFREEQSFESVDRLFEQIQTDTENVKKYFENVEKN